MGLRILYNSQDPAHKTPFGVVTPGEVCTMTVAVPQACQTTQVVLELQGIYGVLFREIEFTLDHTEEPYEYYKVQFTLQKPGLFYYYFRISTRNEQFRLMKQGTDTNMETGDMWQLSCVTTAFPVPEEYQGRVFYQIFPDRFNQVGTCDCTDKLQPYWVHRNKNDTPVYKPNQWGEVLNNDFYGGNLAGIKAKLPYLQDLGVQALYLNPIFMAYSTHRYDTADYSRVDPMLGTDEDFRALCEDAHARDIKIILDGVFSHTGSNSKYFDDQKIFGNGAVSNPDSPYRKWYLFKTYPTEYTSWWGFKTLPNINKLEPSFMDYIFGSDDSIVAKWLRLGADGVRLDVADELPDEFLMGLRKRIRQLNPRAFVVGEVWEDASCKISYGVWRRYFTEAQLDSVMNYPWRTALLKFGRGEDDGRELGEVIMRLAENYPGAVLNSNLNMVSSHDVSRAITALVDPTDGDREELAKRVMTPEQLELGKERFRLVSFLQFTLPGCPCIYYGDEAGMTGYRDPFNRRYYPWGREDRELQAYIRELAHLKSGNETLKRGDIRILEAQDNRICFSRTWKEDTLLVFCNNSEHMWKIPDFGTCLYGDPNLPPQGVCVIRKEP